MIGRPKEGQAPRISIPQLREMLDSDWPAEIYRSEVLSGRTRSFVFTGLARPRVVEIVHTLLGIELRMGRRRVNVPDLATARYLSIFAGLGVASVAVPYDITRISHIADRLERACQQLLQLVDDMTRTAAPGTARSVRRRVLRALRTELTELAGGARDSRSEPPKLPKQ